MFIDDDKIKNIILNELSKKRSEACFNKYKPGNTSEPFIIDQIKNININQKFNYWMIINTNLIYIDNFSDIVFKHNFILLYKTENGYQLYYWIKKDSRIQDNFSTAFYATNIKYYLHNVSIFIENENEESDDFKRVINFVKS